MFALFASKQLIFICLFLFVTAISKEEVEDPPRGKLPYNGYSDEFLDRLEPNGNIPSGKGDLRYGKFFFFIIEIKLVLIVFYLFHLLLLL